MNAPQSVVPVQGKGFVLTGYTPQQRSELAELITANGGLVVDIDLFDNSSCSSGSGSSSGGGSTQRLSSDGESASGVADALETTHYALASADVRAQAVVTALELGMIVISEGTLRKSIVVQQKHQQQQQQFEVHDDVINTIESAVTVGEIGMNDIQSQQLDQAASDDASASSSSSIITKTPGKTVKRVNWAIHPSYMDTAATTTTTTATATTSSSSSLQHPPLPRMPAAASALSSSSGDGDGGSGGSGDIETSGIIGEFADDIENASDDSIMPLAQPVSPDSDYQQLRMVPSHHSSSSSDLPLDEHDTSGVHLIGRIPMPRASATSSTGHIRTSSQTKVTNIQQQQQQQQPQQQYPVAAGRKLLRSQVLGGYMTSTDTEDEIVYDTILQSGQSGDEDAFSLTQNDAGDASLIAQKWDSDMASIFAPAPTPAPALAAVSAHSIATTISIPEATITMSSGVGHSLPTAPISAVTTAAAATAAGGGGGGGGGWLDAAVRERAKSLASIVTNRPTIPSMDTSAFAADSTMHKSITTSTTATATTTATTAAATADQALTPLPHNPLGSKLVRPLSEPYDVPQHQQHHPVPPSATTLPITAPASEISNGATEDGEQRGYERLEWQTLLTSVVRGDLLRGEKSRYTDSTRPSSTSEDRQAMMGDLWYYIRALMRGWSVDRETAELELERNQAAELVIERVMSFTVDTSPAALADPARTPYAQVRNLLDQVDRLMLLYPSDRQAMLAKPWLASPEFMERLEIIQTWATVIWQLQVCIHTAMVWLGADAGLFGLSCGDVTGTADHAEGSCFYRELAIAATDERALMEHQDDITVTATTSAATPHSDSDRFAHIHRHPTATTFTPQYSANNSPKGNIMRDAPDSTANGTSAESSSNSSGIIGGGSGGSTTTATAASSSSLEYRLSHCRFIEFLLRERKHLEGFFGSVLAELFGALWRVRAAQITYSAEYAHMGLPTSIPRIDAWIRFTELLFRECVARRVEFVCEMRDTPVALVDETLADLKEVIRSALRCREEVVGLTVHDIGWAPAQRNSQELDRHILKAIDVYFDMLFKRMRNVPRQQVHERDAEIVNVELGSWLSLVGDLPIGTETVIARLMMQTQRLMIRFTAHLEAQIKIVPAPSTQPSSAEISPSLPASISPSEVNGTTASSTAAPITLSTPSSAIAPATLTATATTAENAQVRHIAQLVEDCRNRSRQMLRLGKQMANRAITSSEYECHNSAELIFALHTAGYVLVYTFGAFEDHGEYVFARLADEYVRGKPIRAMMTLRGVADDASAAIGSNAFKAGSTASMARTADMRLCDHMLVLATQDDVDWSGDVLDMPDLARPDMGIEPGRVRLITASQAELKRCRPFFENSVQHCSLSLAEFQMSPLALVQREVIKLRRATFRLTEGILSLPHAVIEVHNRHSPCPELLHEAVNLISECASLAGVVFDPAHSFQLRIHMVKLCSTWCTFLVDNCEALAEDRRTFKWLVEALEMTAALANEQVITRLSEIEFRTLRSNVGRALTLLTSHFDAFERRPLVESPGGGSVAASSAQPNVNTGASAATSSTASSTDSSIESIPATGTVGHMSASAAAAVLGAEAGLPQIPLSAAVAATAVTSTGPSPVSSMATDPTRTISLPQRRTLHDLHRAWVAGIRRLDDSHDSKRRSKERIGQVLEPSGNPEVEHLAVLASNPAAYPCRWQQGRYIGGGAYGSVYLAINLDLREYMAVKEIRFPDTTTLAATLNKIHDEMHIMSKLLHPNIVQYYGIEVHRDKVCLFMEYCAGGALSQQIDQGRIEDEYLVKLFTVQILSGLEYLHHHSIVHRDIKPDNILLSETGIVKFIDFGAAKSLTQNVRTLGHLSSGGGGGGGGVRSRTKDGRHQGQQQQSQQSQHHPIMQRTLVGTPNYLAPEVITNSHSENSSAQDIWSLGCVVLELVTGHRPWSHLDNEYAVMFRVVNESPALPPPSQMSEEGLDFLSTCFTRNPAKRPTASQLLEHPWMADMQAFRNPVELSKSVEELESEQPH